MGAFTKIWDWICAFFTRYIAEPILAMQVVDMIDILLLAVLLFEIYRFFRARRAGRVMFGLLLVVVFGIAVSLFQLPALTYIVRLFAAAAFFCIVVIFQPEIRDALESLGNLTFFNPRSSTISHKRMPLAKNVADETVDAVMTMSKSKTGALIVFEGMTKLGDYIRTGTILDAQVSSKLLQNIFYGHSPLHDGAMIIRDLRIHAASCVLPSSTRNTVDFASMGTRHRAAVGVTELSDALVVVVSEQTGRVSVAQDGKLLRDVDAKTLKDILMTYIAGTAYLRAKRANMRKDYLEMMEDIARVEPPVKPTADEKIEKDFEKLFSQKAPQGSETEADASLDEAGQPEKRTVEHEKKSGHAVREDQSEGDNA